MTKRAGDPLTSVVLACLMLVAAISVLGLHLRADGSTIADWIAALATVGALAAAALAAHYAYG